MANREQLAILKQGVAAWNQWREANPDIQPDLNGLNLRGAKLSGINFNSANLRFITLSRADLSHAKLREADLRGGSLRRANLEHADLTGAILRHTTLAECQIEQAIFSNSQIYGIAAWNLQGEPADQSNLIICAELSDPVMTVDDLEVAQFVNLLLHNEKIRDVINTIGQKAVLILGRFALPERKAILEAMRNKLRANGYLPIVFDFEKSAERDFTETIQVLAGMCLFVIADITNPKSSPLELQATVPNYMIPFAPIIQAGENPFAMFVDLQHKYKWVLDARQYADEADLIANFERGIIQPALEKHNELLIAKNEALRIRGIGE